MGEIPVNRQTIAAQEFHRARRRAAMEGLAARVAGESAGLLSYEAVAEALQVRGQSSGGLKQVPIAAIIGSVGRYNDFSRSFLPLQDNDQDRWVSVKTAAAHVGDLPPVELYQIDDAYFVLDGNHRISIARQQDLEYIDAYVTIVKTRVPLPDGASPDALIIAAEYGSFLEWTHLDRLRPNADFIVSVPGQYAHLENHIEAYRFVTEHGEGVEFSVQEAAARWYDETFLPLVEAIREQGVLRYFPGRTETDFFIWLTAHRAALQTEFGIQLSPESTVSRLLTQIDVPEIQRNRSFLSRVRRRLTSLVATEADTQRLEQSWTQMRTLARYSDHLFADLLVPVDLSTGPVSLSALRQALALAIEEDARLGVVGILPAATHAADDTAIAQLEETVRSRCEALGLETTVIIDRGEVVDVVGRMAQFHDLIVMDRQFGQSGSQGGQNDAILQLMRSCHRPLYLAGAMGDRPLARRVVDVIDATPQSREGLFVAAYLAETCLVELGILPLGPGQAVSEATDHAQAYLMMHEIDVDILQPASEVTLATTAEAALAYGCDLLIVPAPFSRSRRTDYDKDLITLIENWPHSLLIAT